MRAKLRYDAHARVRAFYYAMPFDAADFHAAAAIFDFSFCLFFFVFFHYRHVFATPCSPLLLPAMPLPLMPFIVAERFDAITLPAFSPLLIFATLFADAADAAITADDAADIAAFATPFRHLAAATPFDAAAILFFAADADISTLAADAVFVAMPYFD